jgi:predicted PurR-regulated permease PerM
MLSGRESRGSHVTVRDVLVVVGVLLAISLALFLLYELRRVLVWLVLAIFFAAVLTPFVDRVERSVRRRGVAVAIVMVTITLLLGGIVFAFARPVIDQSVEFAENLPDTIDRVRDAPLITDLRERLNIDSRVGSVGSDLPNQLLGLSGPLLSVFASIGQAIVGFISIVVFTIFLLLYGPRLVRTGDDALPDEVRGSATRIAERSMRAVSGWVVGNLLTSVVAAVASLLALLALGLPYAFLLALWVGMADLVPLIGATIGALPAIVVAFLHSTTAGVVVTIFFIVYQQFENHVLQPLVYGRTIRLNPFVVLLAVVIGVELAGFIGAVVALPIAGILQVAAEELWGPRASLGSGSVVVAHDHADEEEV